jgi:hypothetical protein
LKGPPGGRQAGQAVGMVAGRLRALAVVEAVGPGQGGGACRSWRRWRRPSSPELEKLGSGGGGGEGQGKETAAAR